MSQNSRFGAGKACGALATLALASKRDGLFRNAPRHAKTKLNQAPKLGTRPYALASIEHGNSLFGLPIVKYILTSAECQHVKN
jgi:hypothetical protein